MMLIVAGSRNISPTVEQMGKHVCWFIAEMFAMPPLDDKERHIRITEVVCGMAKGVDMAGHAWALVHGIAVHEYPAKYYPGVDARNRIAPKERNWRMARYADAALVVWDGYSGGCAHMVACMVALGKIVRIARPR